MTPMIKAVAALTAIVQTAAGAGATVAPASFRAGVNPPPAVTAQANGSEEGAIIPVSRNRKQALEAAKKLQEAALQEAKEKGEGWVAEYNEETNRWEAVYRPDGSSSEEAGSGPITVEPEEPKELPPESSKPSESDIISDIIIIGVYDNESESWVSGSGWTEEEAQADLQARLEVARKEAQKRREEEAKKNTVTVERFYDEESGTWVEFSYKYGEDRDAKLQAALEQARKEAKKKAEEEAKKNTVTVERFYDKESGTWIEFSYKYGEDRDAKLQAALEQAREGSKKTEEEAKKKAEEEAKKKAEEEAKKKAEEEAKKKAEEEAKKKAEEEAKKKAEEAKKKAEEEAKTREEEAAIAPQNWGSAEQNAAVKAFLDAHPTGTKWDNNTTYNTAYGNFSGCAAYAKQLQDIAYGSETSFEQIVPASIGDIMQYDMAYVGGHWIFVLQVLPGDNAVRTAEGNRNSATYNEGIWSFDSIYYIYRPVTEPEPEPPVIPTPPVPPAPQLTDEQSAAVKAFLDAHPTGSSWDKNTTYNGYSGNMAYAQQLQDIAYTGQNTTGRKMNIYSASELQPYDIVNTGNNFFVVVLELLPEENSFRAAQGAYMGKTVVNDAVWSMDKVYRITRPELVDGPKAEDYSIPQNWGTDEQNAAVQAFLDAHPTGSRWDGGNAFTYRSFGACSAYALQLQDIAYGHQSKYTSMIYPKTIYDIRQYDYATIPSNVGVGHNVFILEVYPEKNEVLTAEGNFNGKTFNGGLLSFDQILYVEHPRSDEAIITPPPTKATPNWGTTQQNAAVQAFLEAHPTGTKWGTGTWYKTYRGDEAYSIQLQDIAYGSEAKDVAVVTPKTINDVCQYDRAFVMGDYEVFILEVLPEQNACRTAEGDRDGKTFNEGVISFDQIISLYRPIEK